MRKKLLSLAAILFTVAALTISVSANTVFETDFSEKGPFFENGGVTFTVENNALTVHNDGTNYKCPGLKLADVGMELGKNYAVIVTGKILCELNEDMHMSIGTFNASPKGGANQYAQLAGEFSTANEDLGPTGNFKPNEDGTFEFTAYFNGGYLNSDNYNAVEGILPQGGYNKNVTDYEFYSLRIVELDGEGNVIGGAPAEEAAAEEPAEEAAEEPAEEAEEPAEEETEEAAEEEPAEETEEEPAEEAEEPAPVEVKEAEVVAEAAPVAVEETTAATTEETPVAAGDTTAASTTTKASADTGIEGVAIVAGLALLATGAMVISRKRK